MTHKPISEADMAKLRKSTVVLSTSGGKDSTACGLLLKEHDIPFKATFADTGWEHEDTIKYIDSLERVFGPIARVGYPGGMRGMVNVRGFPSKKQRFCTDHLKRLPLARWQYENLPSAKRQAPSADCQSSMSLELLSQASAAVRAKCERA